MGLLPASYGTNTPAMIHRRNSLATLGVEKRIFHGPTRRRCCVCPQMRKLARCTVSGMHHQSDTTYHPGKGRHARAIQADRLGPSSLKQLAVTIHDCYDDDDDNYYLHSNCYYTQRS